jgi:hypothetical protein
MKSMKAVCFIVVAVFIGSASAADEPPFGGDKDVKYAKKLWEAMTKADYVGESSRMSRPYTGQHPHGAILDTVEGKVKVKGKTLQIIVKRNYGGEGVSIANVSNDPARYLKSVTVMLKRPGYDPETKDWFWAKYKADGSLDTNPKGMMLAGKVAKGKPKGCIACHSAAPGGDMMFLHD